MAVLSEIQTMIKDQAEAWVVEQAPVRAFRQMRDADQKLGFDQSTWQAMVDMGWTGVLVPEAYGGSGQGYMSFGLLAEQLGRQLVASPLQSSALVGVSALLLAGTEQQKEALFPGVVEGSEILALAIDETAHHQPVNISARAKVCEQGYKLSGSKVFVPEGMAATTYIVALRTDGEPGDTQGMSLFLLPSNAQGVVRERAHTMDSRGYATVTLDGVIVPGDALLGVEGEGGVVLEALLDRARAALAAEMLGTASQAFDMTLEYLKTRQQFGKIIGSFQALGHRAAALFTQMELARSCVEAALQAADDESAELTALSSLAKAKVGEFLFAVSNELIQIHGGIGMTDEFDAGLYLKRARVQEVLFGNQAYHRRRYARFIGL